MFSSSAPKGRGISPPFGHSGTLKVRGIENTFVSQIIHEVSDDAVILGMTTFIKQYI